MNEAVNRMLAGYKYDTTRDIINALREILQEIVLLGLWRSKFFEHAAFYGGTALRILYGLDRFSEDLDFSLLAPDSEFDLGKYTTALEKELRAFGFEVLVDKRNKAVSLPTQSAFLKTSTLNALLMVTADNEIAQGIPAGQLLKIKLEVDTEPPAGFGIKSKYGVVSEKTYLRVNGGDYFFGLGLIGFGHVIFLSCSCGMCVRICS